MESGLLMYNVEEMITKALKNKTLIPKAIYNIKIEYGKLDNVLDKLFKSDVKDIADMKDITSCLGLLKISARKAICKNLLSFGLPLIHTGNYKDTFTSNVILWLESCANNDKYITLLDFDNEITTMIVYNEIINILDIISINLKNIDPNVLDISDFFTYSSHDYISVND